MAGIALAQGSSVTLTVLATDTILLDSNASGSATIEAVTGVPGSANSVKLVNHPGGQATYGPFGAGTVKLSAVGGALAYMQGVPKLTDETPPTRTGGARNNIATRAWALGAPAVAAFNAVAPGIAPTVGQIITFGLTTEVSATFDAVRIIVMNASATSAVIASATATAIASMATESARRNDAGFAAPATFLFNGSAGITIAGGSVSAPVFIVSDSVDLASVARSDGGTLPAIALRLSLTANASGATTPMTYWNRGGTDWSATNATAKVYTYSPTVVGDMSTGVYNTSNEASTGNTPIFGVQYISKGDVVTTLWPGDSIPAGTNLTQRKSRGFPVASCLAVSTPSRPVEFCVAGFAGLPLSTVRTFLATAYAGTTNATTGIKSGATILEVLQPTNLVVSSWSVNNAASSTITDADITAMRKEVAKIIAQARISRISTALWNGIPRGTSTSFYDATDVTKRQAYNAEALTWGHEAQDIGFVLAAQPLGVASGFLAANTSDGVHPSDTGDALLTTEAMKLIQRLVDSYYYV